MISLTDQLHNVIYINPTHIVQMQVCGINEVCDLTEVNYERLQERYATGFVRTTYLNLDKHALGVRIHLITGKSIIVYECMSEILRLIKQQ